MAKPDLLEEEENDQDALTLQDKNLIETYKAGSNYIKNVQKEMNHSSLLVNNNNNDLDTSDEEVNKLFCLNCSIFFNNFI
jgi:hypothetical protein